MSETLRPQTLLVRRLRCDPERFGRHGAALLAGMDTADAQPVLLLAELEGDALLLGRHQRASSALDLPAVAAAGLPIHRRLGGGKTIRAGAGCIGVLLAVPQAGALLQAPVGAEKVINRYIRGLLAGLTAAGAGSGAHYFGRDFISAASRQIGVVSQDGSASGAAILEAIVGIERDLLLPAGLSGYPVHEDPRAAGPESAALSTLWKEPHSFEAIAAGIAAGYARLLGCELEPVADADVAPEGAAPAPAVHEAEEGWEESGVADIAIGFAEALLRHEGDEIREVRFRGDFIAPAFALRDLEEALVGCPLDFTAIGLRVDAAFRRPGATILGLRSMRVLADAVLAAAGKA